MMKKIRTVLAKTWFLPAAVVFAACMAPPAESLDDESTPAAMRSIPASADPRSWRGENGNPGEFELYYGELGDARAAVTWMRARPEVDPDRVFVFGHSAGGVLAALISFYPDTGLWLAGSAGGLYDTEVLDGLEPFDPADTQERLLRVPAPNADQFRVAHIGYVGASDTLAQRGATTAARIAKTAGSPLTIETVPGNHFASLEPALQRFLARVQQDLAHR